MKRLMHNGNQNARASDCAKTAKNLNRKLRMRVSHIPNASDNSPANQTAKRTMARVHVAGRAHAAPSAY